MNWQVDEKQQGREFAYLDNEDLGAVSMHAEVIEQNISIGFALPKQGGVQSIGGAVEVPIEILVKLLQFRGWKVEAPK